MTNKLERESLRSSKEVNLEDSESSNNNSSPSISLKNSSSKIQKGKKTSSTLNSLNLNGDDVVVPLEDQHNNENNDDHHHSQESGKRIHHHSLFLRYLKKILGDKITFPQLRVELISLVQLAWPVVASFLFLALLNITILIFIGRLGAVHLGAAALSFTVTNVTGVSFFVGLLSAFETLGSQAFGAKNYERVGLLVQRCIVIVCVMSVPIALTWYFTYDFLMLLGQDHELALLCKEWLLYEISGLIQLGLFETLKRYLQVQGINGPVMIVSGLAAIWNLFAAWLFIDLLELGFIGGPIALVSTWTLQCIGLIGYIRIRKLHSLTWRGWDFKGSFSGWLEIFKLGTPGFLMLAGEWWGFEICTLLAGLVGVTELAAHTVLAQTTGFLFMLPLGVNVAVATRVGQLLGAGQPEAARLVSRLMTFISFIVQVIFVLGLISGHSIWGHIYSDDENVLELLNTAFILLGFFVFFDGWQGSLAGIIKGTGTQRFGAIITMASYYGCAIPLAALNIFVFHWGLYGIWAAMALGPFIITIGYLIVFTRVNWTEVSKRAVELAQAAPQAEAPLNPEQIQNAQINLQQREHLLDDPENEDHIEENHKH